MPIFTLPSSPATIIHRQKSLLGFCPKIRPDETRLNNSDLGTVIHWGQNSWGNMFLVTLSTDAQIPSNLANIY